MRTAFGRQPPRDDGECAFRVGAVDRLRKWEVGAQAVVAAAVVELVRDSYESSTPAMDAAVESLMNTPGVFGARMTGGGFGGCVVALAEPGAVTSGWVVHAVDGAVMYEEE